jgi:hypothetical protein
LVLALILVLAQIGTNIRRHACNGPTTEGLAALIDEHVSPLDPVSLLLPLQDLETALQVMDAISAALEPADVNGALRQVDVIPAQIASLRDPQAVAVDGSVRSANLGDYIGCA